MLRSQMHPAYNSDWDGHIGTRCPVLWQCCCVNSYLCTPEDSKRLQRGVSGSVVSITNPSQHCLGNKQYFQPSLTPGSHLPFSTVFRSTAMQASPKFMELSQAPSEIRRQEVCLSYPRGSKCPSPALSRPPDCIHNTLCQG